MIQIKDLAGLLNISQTEMFERYEIALQGMSPSKKISPEESRSLLRKMGWIPETKIMTIAALKGGIGKTFLSTHVAARASMFGFKVLLIDLDPEACATNSLLSENDLQGQKKTTILEILKYSESIEKGIMPTRYPGLHIIPSALKVSKAERIVSDKNPKTLLKRLIENLGYDLVFFELPPSFSTLSNAAYLASHTVLIPCTPNIHSLESVDLTIEAIKEIAQEFECENTEFLVLMNMFNPKRSSSQEVLQILQEDYPHLLLPFQIHDSADILNAINAGTTIFETKCAQKIRDEVDLLFQSLCPLRSLHEDVLLNDQLRVREEQSFAHNLHQHQQQQQDQDQDQHQHQHLNFANQGHYEDSASLTQ